MTLEDWLDTNCRYLEEAVRELPARGDLKPVFAGLKDGQPLVFGFDLSHFDKRFAVNLFQAALREMEADHYVIIAAAWYVKLPRGEDDAAVKTIGREGTGGSYKEQRRECYQITVGDHERSLIAIFDVERDYKGKIRRLVLQNKGEASGMIGQMVDLLVERTVH